MAAFQKRGSSWRAIVRRRGQTYTATFDSRAEAEEWATKTEARILGGEQIRPAVRGTSKTVADLFTRYADEVSPGKRGGRWEKIRLTALGRDKRFDVPATTFTPADLADWRDERLRRVSGSTVNRDLNLISTVFTRAIKEWRLGMAANPVSMIARPKSNPSRRQRIDGRAADRLVAGLGWDKVGQPTCSTAWTAYAFALALETAMRKSELLSIAWKHVHLAERYIHLDATKNGHERDVPLSSRAIALLKILKPGRPRDRLIPISSGNFDKLMRRARIAAGLKHIRMHDARHESTTQLSKKLSNVLELGAVTGHRDLKALRIYFNPTPGELADKLD